MARKVSALRFTFSESATELRFMSRNGRGTSAATGGATIVHGMSDRAGRKAAILAAIKTRVPSRVTTGQ